MANWASIGARLNRVRQMTNGIAGVVAQIDAVADAVRARIGLSSRDLEQRCRAGIEYRLAHGVASAAVTKWDTSENGKPDATRDFDRTHRTASVVDRALGEARHHRYAHVFLCPVDADHDLSRPLVPGTPVRLRVLAGPEVLPDGMQGNDPSRDDWDRAKSYAIQTRRSRTEYSVGGVHPSYLVRVDGLRKSMIRADDAATSDGAEWADEIGGYSVAEVYGQEIDDYVAAKVGSVRALLTKSTLFVRVNTDTMAAQDEEELFGEMMRTLAPRLGMFGIGLLNQRHELDRHDVAVAGSAEVFQLAAVGLTVPEGIPLTKIMPTPPGGLGSDDVSTARSWAEFLEQVRGSVLEPAILQIYERAIGPADREIVWPDPAPATAAEAAQVRAQLATELAALVGQGILEPDEAAELYFERTGQGRPLVQRAPLTLSAPDPATVGRVAGEQAAQTGV